MVSDRDRPFGPAARVMVVDETGHAPAFLHPLDGRAFETRVAEGLGPQVQSVLVFTYGVSTGAARADWLVVRDHINWTGDNPLVQLGAVAPSRRFLDVKGAYDGRMSESLRAALAASGTRVENGIYLSCPESDIAARAVRDAATRWRVAAAGPGCARMTLAARFAGLAVGTLCALLPEWPRDGRAQDAALREAFRELNACGFLHELQRLLRVGSDAKAFS